MKAAKQNEGFTLMDGEAQHAAHPDTFYMPPIEEREGLKRGDLAKCIFEVPGYVGERMWVTVEATLGKGIYLGSLNNEAGAFELDDYEFLVKPYPIHCGDVVYFEAKHVICAMTPEEMQEMVKEWTEGHKP